MHVYDPSEDRFDRTQTTEHDVDGSSRPLHSRVVCEKLEEREGDSLVTFPALLHRHMFMAQFSCVSFYCSSEYFNERFEVDDVDS